MFFSFSWRRHTEPQPASRKLAAVEIQTFRRGQRIIEVPIIVGGLPNTSKVIGESPTMLNTQAPANAFKHFADDPFVIRNFRQDDQPEARRLYRGGLLIGQIDPYDEATDLEHIEEVYIHRPPNHFWVAEAGEAVIGTIAMLQENRDIAHVRRLRVAQAWQLDWRVAVRLVQVATAHARDNGFLKLILHTPVDDRRAVPLLQRLGLEFARTRKVHDRQVLEFYLSLYSTPTRMDQATSEDWRLA
jgi:N-acetylglutamate synthase-like GNAT family acetyltransferase